MRKDLQSQSPAGKVMQSTVVGTNADEMAVDVEFQVGLELTNRIGTVAGGFIAAMMDSVTGLAALSILPENQMAVHTKLELEYLRPGQPGRFAGRGRVVGRDERDIRSQGELVDSTGEVVARGSATLRIIERRKR
jgi:uncharacterized protein (TIGR00369 family)